MFTGITRGTFPITVAERSGQLLRFTVELPAAMVEGLQIGASVSIDGVCQTVVEIDGQHITFEAIEETLRLTTLDELREGSQVAVERSFKVGDEVGGHEVSGHVSGTGTIESVHEDGDVHDLRIGVPGEWMKYILEKGFVAVDGSSLTVGETSHEGERGAFVVHLIPETLRLTNLGKKAVGARVNIELDARTVAIVETVERVLAEREMCSD
ncbi:MAG: riboflavin synthase subunit alpha [Myxococcales bacterium]|nr:riboflavin synthase subunit alpha [Myxococcales bacterium]